jgi:hypothetical protein
MTAKNAVYLLYFIFLHDKEKRKRQRSIERRINSGEKSRKRGEGAEKKKEGRMERN